MIKLLTAVTFILICQEEVDSYLRFAFFKRVVIIEREASSWSVDNVSSKLKCTTLCLAGSECAGFSCNEANGSCQAFSPGVWKAMGRHGFEFTAYYSKRRSVNICENDKDCYGKGSVCFRGNCRCDTEFTYNIAKQACVRKPGGMHELCGTKEQCHINGSVCLKGRCICTPGLSYDKKEQACVRKCRKYGKTMSTYMGLAIVGHDDENIKGYSKEKCIDRCTTVTNFLCLSVDINIATTECALSRYGYLDVNDTNRKTGKLGWLFGTRNCAFD